MWQAMLWVVDWYSLPSNENRYYQHFTQKKIKLMNFPNYMANIELTPRSFSLKNLQQSSIFLPNKENANDWTNDLMMWFSLGYSAVLWGLKNSLSHIFLFPGAGFGVIKRLNLETFASLTFMGTCQLIDSCLTTHKHTSIHTCMHRCVSPC